MHLRLIAQSRVKTDKIDAGVIGELLRVGFFPKVTLPPKEIREVRELLRGRIKISRNVAQAKNRLHGLLTRTGIDYETKQVRGAGVEAWLESLPLTASQRFMADIQLLRRVFYYEGKTSTTRLDSDSNRCREG